MGEQGDYWLGAWRLGQPCHARTGGNFFEVGREALPPTF